MGQNRSIGCSYKLAEEAQSGIHSVAALKGGRDAQLEHAGATLFFDREKSRSCQHVSTKDSQPPERMISLLTSRLPRSKRTARRASLGLIPCFIFSSSHLLVSAKLLSQLSVDLLLSEKRPEPGCDISEQRHSSPYEASKILPSAATCLPHSRVSLSSLFRPFAVRV